MEAYVRSTKEQRMARDRARRQREHEARVEYVKHLLRLFVGWLGVQVREFPRRVHEGLSKVFICAIFLILCAAVFFACLGMLEMAFTFWVNQAF